jgi:hypothetical protein
MNFYDKYLKYKTKYLKLKEQFGSSPPFKFYYVPLLEAPYNAWTINGKSVTASNINYYLSQKAESIDKPTLLTNLKSINKCYITESDNKTFLALCANIHSSNNVIIGVSDAEGTFGFIDINLGQAEENNILFISWAVSDNSNKMYGTHKGKGKELISIANLMAKDLSIPSLACVPTSGSLTYWTENGFVDTGLGYYTKPVY